jgi:hypothetical protein
MPTKLSALNKFMRDPEGDGGGGLRGF